MKKRTISMLLTVAMVAIIALTGCGKENPKNAAEVFAKSQEQSNEAKSVDAKANMKINMASGEESFDMNVDMDMTVFTDPYKAKIHMNMDMGQLGSQETDMYMMTEDGKYNVYTGMLGQWYKEEMDQSLFEQTIEGYDNSAYMDILVECANSFTMEEVEENGKKVYKLEGAITGDDMKKMMESVKMMEQLESITGGEELLEDMGDMKMTVWVDKETYDVGKISMDMTDMMKKMIDKAASEEGSTEEVTINTCVMDMEYTSYNSSEDFELPEEAKNASSMPSQSN